MALSNKKSHHTPVKSHNQAVLILENYTEQK